MYLICLLPLRFESSCLGWLRERCVLRAEICCFFVLLIGYPGHCDEGRSQNLIAMVWLPNNNLIFVFEVFVALLTGPLLA